jgi:hypothetical protein
MIDLVRSQTVPVVVENQPLSIGGRFGAIRTEFSAFSEIPPPPGWTVPANATAANVWECWLDASESRYCHPVGSVRFPNWTASLIRAGDLSGGVSLVYRGLWQSHVRINIACAGYSDWNIPIGDATVVSYTADSALGGAEYVFNISSRTACPQNLTDPRFPRDPRPAPPSDAPQVTEVAGPYGLGLGKLRDEEFTALLGHGDEWHIGKIHFSPVDRVGCPVGTDCGVYKDDEANVWKCVGLNFEKCYPVGDRSYGLSMDFVDPNDEASGVVAVYAGGADDFQVALKFTCDPDLPPRDTIWDEIVDEAYARISFNVSSAQVCRKDDWGQVNGGAFFLFAVVAAFFLYFGVGTLGKWIVTGYVEVPNEGLWVEIWASVVGALKFIGSCGKETPIGRLYDKV